MHSKPKGMQRVQTASFRMAFHAAGMRVTRQRTAIYRELMGRYDHPDVEMLYKAVRPRMSNLSLFTVYRTVNALETAGMVRRVATWKGHARYDGNVETHAHFLCETCGRIVDVDVGDVSDLCRRVEGNTGKVSRVDVMFYGEGPICQGEHAAAREKEPLKN